MSHEILDKMFYAQDAPAWHAINEPSTEPHTAEEVANNEHFKGLFPIEMRPYCVILNGNVVQVPNGFAIVRAASIAQPQEMVFDTCTDHYHPIQPMEFCKLFDQNVGQPVETMAFLKEGRLMFITWKLPGFEIRPDDFIQLYGSILASWYTLRSADLYTTLFRQVCANTLALGESWAKAHTNGEGLGKIYKGKASNPNLLEHLGYWMSHVQGKAEHESAVLKEFLSVLADHPLKKDSEVHKILEYVYPDVKEDFNRFPKELRDRQKEKLADKNETVKATRNGIFTLWQGQGRGITRDFYGLLNATTEYFNHYQPSKKPVAYSIMFGPRQQEMLKMVLALKALAKK